jgi:hypothetical protein
MARTTFKIDQEILKDIRIKAKKTQMDVGLFLREHAGKDAGLAQSNSATSVYQKIERTGRTSPRSAAALAKYFDVPLQVLQGVEAINTLERITERLTLLLDKGSNEALNSAFEAAVKNTTYFSNVSREGPTRKEKIGWLAEDIAGRIESAQWTRDPVELEALRKITERTEDELLAPAYVEGNWWVVSHGIALNEDFNSTATVIRGVIPLKNFVERTLVQSGIFRLAFRDQTIHLSRKGLWHGIEVLYPKWGIEFVRCEPDGAKGVRWTATSPQNKWFLEESLRVFAYSRASSVVNFDGKTVPADVRRSCLVVTQHQVNSTIEIARMVVRGYAYEWADEVISKRIQYGEAHMLIQAGLQGHLKRSLHPLLRSHAAKRWSVAVADFALLEPCLRLTLFEDTPMFPDTDIYKPGLTYQISLMEELPDGSFVHAPWPTASVEKLCESVKEWIGTPLPEDGYDDGASFELVGKAK